MGMSHRVPSSSGLLRRHFYLGGGREALGSFEGCCMVRPLLLGSFLFVETSEVGKVARWRVSI